MKANRSIRFKDNNEGYVKLVSGLLVLLLAIVIGILIFWNVSPNMPGNVASRTEIFTGYTLPSDSDSSGGSNDTATTVTLTYVPYRTTNASIAVVCYNSSAETQCSPPVTITNKNVVIQSGSGTANPAGYDQINVTYTPMIYDDIGTTETNAGTVFGLLPIIAIVVIGSIMIGLIAGFGKGKKGV